MSQNVDVLAVMENALMDIAAIGELPSIRELEMKEARAAVSELIEATTAYLDERKWYNPLYANKSQFDTFAAIESRLTAALVRARGVA